MNRAEYQASYEDELFDMFPDVVSGHIITRKQLTEFVSKTGKKWPTWLTRLPVGRGAYRISPIEEDSEFASDCTNDPAVVNMALSAHKPVEVIRPRAVKTYGASMDSLIPSMDSNYVPFGNYSDVEVIIKSGMFYPTYIAGPTGNGKSTMVEQVCAKLKRQLIRVNLNMMTDEEQLIGSKTLIDGNVKIVEGPVLIAMRTGSVLLLDETDAGNANTLLCLQPILEGKPFYFKLNNEIVHPAAGFNVFATANTKGKGSHDGRYIGTNILNEAFLERFAVTLNQDYPTPTIEKRIVKNLMFSYECYDEQYCTTLIKWVDAIRRTFNDGGVDELITTRRLTHIVRAYLIFNDQKKAVELCCNRFDDITRIAFIDLFDKISGDHTDPSEFDTINDPISF